MAGLDEARRAKAELKHALEGRPDVTAIGIVPEPDGYGLLVRVRDGEVRPHGADLPSDVGGVHVHVRTSGPVTTQG